MIGMESLVDLLNWFQGLDSIIPRFGRGPGSFTRVSGTRIGDTRSSEEFLSTNIYNW